MPFSEGRETKKRTTLARLLKGLKTVNRRDRMNNQNTSTQVRVSVIHFFLKASTASNASNIEF